MVPSAGSTWDRGGRSQAGACWEVKLCDTVGLSARRQMKSVRFLGRNSHWLLPSLAQCTSSLYLFFSLVWFYLLWQTSPGDHPSFDKLEKDCIGSWEGGELKRGRKRLSQNWKCMFYEFVKVCSELLLLQIKMQWHILWKSSQRKYLSLKI